MREGELRFEVELNNDIVDAIFRLPPGLLDLAASRRDDILDSVRLECGSIGRIPVHPRIARETAPFSVRVGDDAILLRFIFSARRIGIKILPPPDQQIARGWKTLAAVARAIGCPTNGYQTRK